MDQRALDQLVRSITRELAKQQPEQNGSGDTRAARRPAPARPASRPGRAGRPDDRPRAEQACWLIDNWRVRESERDQFLAFYRTHVAEVLQRFPGYVSGRVLVAPPSSDYAWHVQAMYEFESDAVRDSFDQEFDRQIRKVDPRMTREKVLDEMDKWVLGHEDGSLTEVWR
ncbi:hypothetical protein ACFQS1_27520 [Paractinoplanes rhizophilus]|uniref:Uncharacterized protein n=1 Tax=Paractinoplanes rhizophilus TaxID=1416877 RepID=A0ABW2I0N2_9ACTN